MLNISWFLTKYTMVRCAVYWGCWAAVFIVLMVIAHFSPKTAIWLMSLASPISEFIKDLFWGFAPEGSQGVRAAGKFFGTIGRGMLKLTSDKTQVFAQLAILNGFLAVSIAAWPVHMAVMYFVKQRLVRHFFTSQGFTSHT